jgi:hypothetical protein
MAYNELTCGTNAGNTGLQECAENFGYFAKFVIVPRGTSFATQALALDLDNWVTALNAVRSERYYPTPEVVTLEADQEATVYEELIAGKREFIREGKDRLRAVFESISMHNHKELQKHNSRKDLSIFILTSSGFVLGYSLDGVKMLPLDLDEIHFEKRTISDGDTKDRSAMSLVLKDSDQWNKTGVWIKPDALTTDAWDAMTDIYGVKDVSVTIASTTGTGLVATVKGTSDSQPTIGLVLADFSLKTSAGVVVTITGATDNGDGTYTITYGTISGAHGLTLKNQPAMTQKFIEAVNTASFTI